MTNRLLLLAALSLAACAPTRGTPSDAGPSLAPSGGDDPDAWFLIHSPIVSDADGDGVWEEGEELTLEVQFTNQRGEAHYYYPGILASTDVSEVVATGGENWWYGIEPDMTYEAWLTFQPGSASAGTVVTLIAEASSLACDDPDDPVEFCPEPNPLLVPVRLGDRLPDDLVGLTQ